jgi:hypothetical protein
MSEQMRLTLNLAVSQRGQAGSRIMADLGALLASDIFANAVSNIVPRAERQPKLDALEETYVETGVFPQLDNANNQILYGRRGTGKTHLLRVLGAKSHSAMRVAIPVYIDIRVLGSAQLMADPTKPLVNRCVSVFRDLLAIIQSVLLDVATDPANQHHGRAFEQLSMLHDVMNSVVAESTKQDVELTRAEARQDTSQAGLELGIQTAKLHLGSDAETTSSAASKRTYTEALRTTIVFAEIAYALGQTLEALQCDRLLVLIDEWTAIPDDIQPLVAEFLKRTLLPSARVTLKIASLEYRSRFSIPRGRGNLIGFEIGPDIAANLDLDDYYVYERNPDRVVDMFRELLFRHLLAELAEAASDTSHLQDAVTLSSKLFTEPATFVELVRAGEGVVRDFLGIFSSAYFRAKRSGRSKIDMHSVEEASRDWYETDKAINLSTAQSIVLHRIMSDVIGNRQAKSFMLARHYAAHPMIQSLFDLRLVHLTLRGYSDKESPGLRYNIYSLDYGTYVDLKRTRAAPQTVMLEFDELSDPDKKEHIVPFSDKRSIRRVILDPTILDVSSADAREYTAISGSVGVQIGQTAIQSNIVVNIWNDDESADKSVTSEEEDREKPQSD